MQKSTHNHPKIIPTSPPNHPQIIPTSSRNHTKINPKSLPKHTRITPTSSPNHPNIIPKSSQNVCLSLIHSPQPSIPNHLSPTPTRRISKGGGKLMEDNIRRAHMWVQTAMRLPHLTHNLWTRKALLPPRPVYVLRSMPQAGPLNGERGREVSWRNHYLAHTTRKHQFIGDVSPMRHLLKPHQPIACLECNMHHGASERLIRCRLFQFKNSGGRLICLCFQNHIFKNDCFFALFTIYENDCFMLCDKIVDTTFWEERLSLAPQSRIYLAYLKVHFQGHFRS